MPLYLARQYYLGIPIIVLAMIIKILIFTYFPPLLKTQSFSNLKAWDTAASTLCMSSALCCHTYKHPCDVVLPRVTQPLAHGCDTPQTVHRRVSGALPAAQRFPLGSSAAASFGSAVQAARLCRPSLSGMQ